MERGRLAEILGASGRAGPAESRLVEGRDPHAFMAGFVEAIAGRGNVFLGDASWGGAERAAAARHLQGPASGERGWLMIPSGGTSAGLRFARHDSDTIEAAVRGFSLHFGIERVHCLGLLPLHHVSGLMAWMRSAMTGGTYLPWSWKDAEAGIVPDSLPEGCCISLVPTQLQRLIRSPDAVRWLRGFRVVFVGGAPSWAGLLDEGARLGLPLSPGYGATETAAMAAAVRPEEFAAGMRGCGRPLPHARIEIVDASVRVSGASVFRGYYPQLRDDRTWDTGDLGEFGEDGSLRVHGRSDSVIITGGKKVSPAEVEDALRASGEFDDVAVLGIADAEWGQAVVAVHASGGRTPHWGRVDDALALVASYKRPKRYIEVPVIPRNAQGKVSRMALLQVVGG